MGIWPRDEKLALVCGVLVQGLQSLVHDALLSPHPLFQLLPIST